MARAVLPRRLGSAPQTRRYSHNEILKTIYGRLLDIASTHVSTVVPMINLEQYLNQRLAIHARIVNAVADGDEEKVAAAAHVHRFTTARSRLVDSPGAGS